MPIGRLGIAIPSISKIKFLVSRADLATLTKSALGDDVANWEICTSQYYAAGTTCPYVEQRWRWAAATDNVASTVAAHPDIGGFWVQKFGEIIDVKQLGAYGNWNGTTGADDTQAIQDALNAAAYLTFVDRVFLSKGRYRVTDTLHMGYGVSYGGTPFVTLEFFGAGGDPNRAGHGSQLDPSFSDRPVVAMSGVRWAKVHNIGFVGLNRSHIVNNSLWQGSATSDWSLPASWVDPTLHANANSRYAPYAAIAIDPYFAATPPSPAYPNVIFPSFLGSPGQYNKPASSTFDINNNYITGFVVGIALNPCGGSSNNTDFLSCSRNIIDNCVYIISVSNANGRCNTVFANIFGQFHTGITCAAHGDQFGNWGGVVINTAFDRCYQIFDIVSPATAGSVEFQNCYGENVFKIGQFGIGFETNQQTLILNQCHIGHHRVDTTYVGRPPWYIAVGFTSQLVIKGGYYGSYTGVYGIWAYPDQTRIEEAVFSPIAPTTTYGKIAHTSSSGGVVFVYDPRLLSRSFTTKFTPQYNYVGTQRNTYGMVDSPCVSDRELPVCIHSKLARSTVTQKPIPILTGRGTVAKGSLASVTLTGTTLTFTYTGRTDALFHRDGPDVGDVLVDLGDSGSVFYVSARTDADVTAILQNNYYIDGSAAVHSYRAFSPSAGNIVFINTRQFVPAHPLFGTLSSVSAVITSAASANGNNTVLTTDLAVGDTLASDQWEQNFASASGTNSEIQSIDTAAKTITMGGNLNITATGILLPVWVRAPVANS